MKTILTVILLLMLAAACGGGGSTVAPIAPPSATQRPATAEAACAAAVGSYTWTGYSVFRRQYRPPVREDIDPSDGRIELADGGIRLVIEMPGQARRIDMLFRTSEITLLLTGVFLWEADSGEWPIPIGGYYYRLSQQEQPDRLILVETHRGENEETYSTYTSTNLVGVRQ